jgi:hypothetical protein
MKPRGVSKLRDLEQSGFRSAGVEEFTAKMQKFHNQIKEKLQRTNKEYKRRVDRHRRELQFEVGDKFLSHLNK